MPERVKTKKMRRSREGPGASICERIARLVAAVAVLRIIVRRVIVARRTVDAVEADAGDEAAIVGLALERQVGLTLALVAIAVAGIGSARRDTADPPAAPRRRLTAADPQAPAARPM